MSRTTAIQHAAAQFECGSFFDDLARRVAYRTESQHPGRQPSLIAYLEDELRPTLEALGFDVSVHPNPVPSAPPLLVGRRIEDVSLPTVLLYGHGDVVGGQEGHWSNDRDPWTLTAEGARWYGRGAADNKAQHSINLGALAAVLHARSGRLGFNAIWLIEMGEETGSPGLAEFCATHRDLLAADVLIASDGPRVSADRPTVFLGSRGVVDIGLVVDLRPGSHHSGNWGGLLRNPGTVLANAIAGMVDERGVVLVDGLRPPPIPDNVRRALLDIEVGGGPDDPRIDEWWGEPGLTAAERVYGWNTLEVLALGCGDPDRPVSAIPGSARATMQLRFVVGTDAAHLREHLEAHLAARGFGEVQVQVGASMAATRLDPDDDWVRLAVASIASVTGRSPALLPNLGGSLPNDVFADVLGLPTVWVPHSYPACRQHAPDEHVLADLVLEGLRMSTAVFWDIGEHAARLPRRVVS